MKMGRAPRVLWGWVPKETIVPVEVDGRTVYRVEREPEFDTEQYELFAALEEYESSLGSHGLPMDETTSPLADPSNPAGEFYYEAHVLRDWYEDAIEKKKAEFKDPSSARVFTAVRRDR